MTFYFHDGLDFEFDVTTLSDTVEELGGSYTIS